MNYGPGLRNSGGENNNSVHLDLIIHVLSYVNIALQEPFLRPCSTYQVRYFGVDLT